MAIRWRKEVRYFPKNLGQTKHNPLRQSHYENASKDIIMTSRAQMAESSITAAPRYPPIVELADPLSPQIEETQPKVIAISKA